MIPKYLMPFFWEKEGHLLFANKTNFIAQCYSHITTLNIQRYRI